MSKPIERTDAPIHTILKMKWSTLEITFKALEPSSQADCMIIAGDVIRTLITLFRYGKPNLTFSKFLLCPKCKQESPLTLEIAKCPKCGSNLKETIES